jgi:hypothetical protein
VRSLAPALGLLLVAGCAGPSPPPEAAPARAAQHIPSDAHSPDFARIPYEPLSRESVVGIALREWRLFGQGVDDDPPGSRPPPEPDQKPERWPGMWQRVGEYWWLGVDPNDKEVAWTGKHDENGFVFPASDDGRYAWSAAFVSYVMRIAGAGPRFPYSPTHADYINIAREMSLGQTSGYDITAERPDAYAPRLGDLICTGRGRSGALRYDNLPAGRFPAHCDFVVQVAPGQLTVVGGNVDDAVTMKHVPTTPDGKLAEPDGTVLDTRYPWMVVLRVLYETPTS